MLTLIKRALAAVIVIAAVAAPTAAYARFNETPVGGAAVPVEPPYIGGVGAPAPSPYAAGAPDADQPAATSSSGFQWGDAGIGAGSLLVLISVGAGTAVAYRRRTQRPLAS
jgi:hypothetical protein